MNVSTHFLTSFSGAEDSNNWDFWLEVLLRRLYIISKQGVEARWRSLIIVYAIESNPKELHNLNIMNTARQM